MPCKLSHILGTPAQGILPERLHLPLQNTHAYPTTHDDATQAICSLIYVVACLQDWTKQESEDAEGIVTFTYRTEPANPPDVKTIQKQMAIVAWQPGANRMVAIPAEVC